MSNQITPKQQMAWDLYQEALGLRGTQTKVALRFGYVLNKINNEKLYRYMGEGGFDTFKHFLVEIKLNYNTATAYMRVYETYINRLQISEDELWGIPFTRLNQLTSKIKDMPLEEQKEWVEKAKVLLRDDFDKEMVEHKLQKVKRVTIRKCRKCEHLKIEYLVDAVCMCDGSPYIRAVPVSVE